jgi:hypothetical protein
MGLAMGEWTAMDTPLVSAAAEKEYKDFSKPPKAVAIGEDAAGERGQPRR